MATHIFQIADPSVHRDILSFLQLKTLAAAGIDCPIGVDGRMIDEDDVLPDAFPLAAVDFNQLSMHHHDVGAGRTGNIRRGMGEESQRESEKSYEKSKLFHIGVLGYEVIGNKTSPTSGIV